MSKNVSRTSRLDNLCFLDLLHRYIKEKGCWASQLSNLIVFINYINYYYFLCC